MSGPMEMKLMNFTVMWTHVGLNAMESSYWFVFELHNLSMVLVELVGIAELA